MAWAGTGAFCVMQAGVLKSYSLSRMPELGPKAASELSFVQISDIHMGFNKAANPNVVGTLKAAVDKIMLARRRRFQQHAWCQSVIVFLNLALIVLTMIPSLRIQVIPKIPLKLGKAYNALATAHAALGTITKIAGLYILLTAVTNVPTFFALAPKRSSVPSHLFLSRCRFLSSISLDCSPFFCGNPLLEKLHPTLEALLIAFFC
jgi:hypothetical protein